jgi:hypothetical protein
MMRPSVMNATTRITPAAGTDERITGWNGHGVVDREAGVVPGEEEAGAVVVEQAGPLEQADDLVPEQLLGGRGADVRHAHPLAGAGPATAGDERVYVRVGVELIPERLGHGDHARAEALLLAGRHGHQLANGLPGRGAQWAPPPSSCRSRSCGEIFRRRTTFSAG